MGLIYVLENKINNIKYIGATKRTLMDRVWEHKADALKKNKQMLIHKAIREFGWENFSYKIIEEIDNEKLEERERYWISKINSLTPNGYNTTKGGSHLYKDENIFYGKIHSVETKEKISIKNTGRVQKENELETRRIINAKERNPFFGKTHTDKMKKYLSESKQTKDIYAKNNEKEIYFNQMSEVIDYILNNSLSKTTSYKSISSFIVKVLNKNKIAYGFYWTT